MRFDDFYKNAYAWVLTFGPRLLISVFIFFFGWWIIRTIKGWLARVMEKRDVDPSLRPFLLSLFVIFLQVLLLLGIMQILGIQMTIFAAVLGAFGVAAGLALSGTLQNFTSGVLILLLKPFRVGDNIIAQGQEGTVTSIQIFYTIVTTFDNRTVILPNSKLSNEVIVNISREGNRRLDIEFKFGFAIDFAQVKTVVEKTINEHKNLLKEPVFRVGISAIESDGYRLMINTWVKAHGYVDTKFELQQLLIDDLLKAGIKLPGT